MDVGQMDMLDWQNTNPCYIYEVKFGQNGHMRRCEKSLQRSLVVWWWKYEGQRNGQRISSMYWLYSYSMRLTLESPYLTSFFLFSSTMPIFIIEFLQSRPFLEGQQYIIHTIPRQPIKMYFLACFGAYVWVCTKTVHTCAIHWWLLIK